MRVLLGRQELLHHHSLPVDFVLGARELFGVIDACPLAPELRMVKEARPSLEGQVSDRPVQVSDFLHRALNVVRGQSCRLVKQEGTVRGVLRGVRPDAAVEVKHVPPLIEVQLGFLGFLLVSDRR